VGIFLERIKDLGMLENTLIIYTTDHGEPFGEHGIIRKARPWPYEELSHIPFILGHPKEIGKGKRIDAFIETCDVMPTILDFLGIEGPAAMQGQSLLPLVSEEIEQLRDYGYSGYYSRSWSIRNKEWSYILWLPESPAPREGTPWTLGGTFKTPRKPELYDRENDPLEQHNLVDEYPDVADELELTLRRFVSTLR
jgi:arylsulfatase A-like enzyme